MVFTLYVNVLICGFYPYPIVLVRQPLPEKEMKQWLILCLIIVLQSCSKQAEEAPEQKPVVIQTFTALEQKTSNVYEFPAVVSAVKNVELRFEVSGRLVSTNLVKGKKVAKGDLLAQIDPAPYQRKVKDREVRHELATNDLKRIEALYKTGGVSHSAFDNAKTQFETTLLDLNNAKQDLSYTKILAPFDGVISDRYVENNSFIPVGGAIATLQDRSSLYFSFDVPERVMTINHGNTDLIAVARIIGLEDQIYNIHYVEHETTPDPVTQTYNVTFAIDNAQETDLIPGSRAIVTVRPGSNNRVLLLVPLAAVIGDTQDDFAVWMFNEQDNTVNKRNVSVGAINGDYAVISSGLSEGEKVVAAGVTHMRENLRVSEYKEEL